MDDDWDLQAVVRGYTTTTTTKTDIVASLSSFQTIQDNQNLGFPDLLFQPTTQSVNEELHDLYKPFFPKIHPLPLSPFSVLRGIQDLSQQQQNQKQLHTKQSVVGTKTVVSTSTTAPRLHQTPRSKKRKNQMKKVCQVPAEGLSSDMWSWRKYGQKPIKGSPYPRGYYRCSTSKGCLARKQVERNRSDPTMFIITYTGDHNHSVPTHRNSLAGSTRHKPTTGDEAGKPTCSSPAASLSPATENINSIEDERENIGGEEDDYDFVSDGFFEGLDEISGESFLDQLPASLPFPRLAAGGG